MASNGKIENEKFNGYSFELWKLKMEDLLVDKDQWIVVDLGTKPMGVFYEEWKKLDRKAKSTTVRNPLAANGCSKRRQMQKERWRNTKLGW